jgi:hypothetical protein
MTKYRYSGNGVGVPGLPHEIDQAEIEQFNETQAMEWQEALSMGLYVEVTDAPAPVRKSKKTAGAQPAEGEQS